MKRKQRKGLIGSIIAIAVALMLMVGAVYAYWDSKSKSADVELKVGQGVELFVEIDSATSGKLVPSTAKIKPGDVTSIEIEVTASLSEALLEPAAFDVVADLTIDYGNLFTIVVNAPTTITKDATILITISFAREPADQTEYDTVANATLTLHAVFTVE